MDPCCCVGDSWLLSSLIALAGGPQRATPTATSLQPPAGAHLASLCASLGWQALLLEALPLLLVSSPPAQQALLADLAGTAAADVASSSDPQLQAAAQQVAACLAVCTQRQLEEQGSSSGSVAQQTQLALMAALQQLLLAAPAVAAAPAVSGGLQQLQSAADASMAGLMQAMQAPGEQQAGLQAVFQQLCQLRARLMLACAGAAAATAGLASTAADDAETAGSEGSMEVGGLHVVADSTQTTAQAWRSVLLMPPDVAAAAAAAASAAACSGSARHPSQQQFFAAWVAATSYQQASSSTGWGSYGGCSSSCDGGSGTAQALRQPPHQVEIPALLGVCFQPPALQATGTTNQSGAASGLEAAAEAAAAEVTRDPDCLGPVHLTLAALQLAQRVAASGEGLAGGSAGAAAAAAWSLLLELASAAAAMAGEPRQQRLLLLVLLHNQQAWPRRLREVLAADVELQRSCRRELVAVANRLASGRAASGWLLSALPAADWCRRCHSCCGSLATGHKCSLHKQSLMPTSACFHCHRTRQ